MPLLPLLVPAAAAAELRIACVNEVTLAVDECGILGACDARFVVELDLEVLSDGGDDVNFTILSTEYKRLFAMREDTMELLPLDDCVDDLDIE